MLADIPVVTSVSRSLAARMALELIFIIKELLVQWNVVYAHAVRCCHTLVHIEFEFKKFKKFKK